MGQNGASEHCWEMVSCRTVPFCPALPYIARSLEMVLDSRLADRDPFTSVMRSAAILSPPLNLCADGRNDRFSHAKLRDSAEI